MLRASVVPVHDEGIGHGYVFTFGYNFLNLIFLIYSIFSVSFADVYSTKQRKSYLQIQCHICTLHI